MPDELEITVNDGQNGGQNQTQNEPPVSFIDHEGDTLVHLGEKESSNAGGANGGSNSRHDEERWRRAEQQQESLAQGFNELRSRLNGGGNGSQGPGASDPYQAEEDAITAEERALGIQWEAHKAARTLTQPLLEDFDKKSRNLTQRRMGIAARRAMSEVVPSILQASQQQNIRNEHADVYSNPNATRFARGHYDQLVARGAPDSPETLRRAMNAARATFGIGAQRMDPTDQDRQQLQGFAGTNRRSADPKANVVKMGKAEKNMALAMYGDHFNGDEKKSYAQWARGPGIRAQRAAQAARRQRSNGW